MTEVRTILVVRPAVSVVSLGTEECWGVIVAYALVRAASRLVSTPGCASRSWSCWSRFIQLEPESNHNLQRSCAACLEYRRQAAARTARAQHQIQHGAGLAKQRAGQEAGRVGKAGVVERVESLDPQLKPSPLTHGEFPAQGQIQLRHAEAAERVSSQAALRGIGSRL